MVDEGKDLVEIVKGVFDLPLALSVGLSSAFGLVLGSFAGALEFDISSDLLPLGYVIPAFTMLFGAGSHVGNALQDGDYSSMGPKERLVDVGSAIAIHYGTNCMAYNISYALGNSVFHVVNKVLK
jgi:hypothetical protein